MSRDTMAVDLCSAMRRVPTMQLTRSVYWFTTSLLLAFGFTALTTNAQTALVGPTVSLVGESGSGTGNNWGKFTGQISGVPGQPDACAEVNQINDPDDCDAESSSSHFVESEWTWTLQAAADTIYTVSTQYTCSYSSSLYGDVDNSWDCDFASMHTKGKLRNDDGGGDWHVDDHYEEVSNPPDEVRERDFTVNTETIHASGVETGHQFSASARIEADAYVKSEARAYAFISHGSVSCTALIMAQGPK